MKRLTGLFLGAGASYEAGMPLVWELTAEIKNWLTPDKLRTLNHGWRVQRSGYDDSVIADLASVLVRPELHYEAILGHLETQFRRHGPRAQEYHGLYSWLVELVYHLLYFRQVNNSAFLDQRLPYYEGIRTLAEENSPLWIFSLNHDVVIEALAARFAIPLHCGFGPHIIALPRRDARGVKSGELRAEVLTKHDLEHHAMYFPNPARKGIYLLKVHGGLDVFTFNDGADLLRLVPDGPGQQAVFDMLRAANEELIYLMPGAPGGRAKATNEIAYADDQGEMQFLRRSLLAGAYKFDPRKSQVLPQSLLKHFRENINFVSTLVCIGYSFGDLHINAILRDWLEFSADRHLEIVSPAAEAIPSFLLHLASQISITKSAATDYLDARAGISRSPRERLDKRLFGHVRALGREQAALAMSEFAKLEKERVARALAHHFAQLGFHEPGKHFDAAEDIGELATKLMTDVQGTEADRLERLLRFFEMKKSG